MNPDPTDARDYAAQILVAHVRSLDRAIEYSRGDIQKWETMLEQERRDLASKERQLQDLHLVLDELQP